MSTDELVDLIWAEISQEYAYANLDKIEEIRQEILKAERAIVDRYIKEIKDETKSKT